MMEGRASDIDNPFVPKKSIYADVSKCLLAKGYPFSDKEVDMKWNNLVRQYKTDLAKKEKSGASFERTPTFDQMERIVGHRHDIKPKNVRGTGLKRDGSTADKPNEKKPRAGPDVKRQMLDKLDNTLSYFKAADEQFRAERLEARKKREDQEERRLKLLAEMVEAMKKK